MCRVHILLVSAVGRAAHAGADQGTEPVGKALWARTEPERPVCQALLAFRRLLALSAVSAAAFSIGTDLSAGAGDPVKCAANFRPRILPLSHHSPRPAGTLPTAFVLDF